MLEFAYPWLFALLPLPVLVRWLLPPYQEPRDAIQVPFFQVLVRLSGATPRPGAVIPQRMLGQKVWLVVAWGLIVVALAKPEWVGEPIVRTQSARDLMIAVDLSGSMRTDDFSAVTGERISRLEAVKWVLQDFVAGRVHDRLGLILFGDAPYLQVPFTEDHDVWWELLAETEIGMAGQRTHFGDAIGLAIKLFEHSDTEHRVLIVLTDGNDTGSKVPPLEAAKIAKAKGIRIYTIAIGDPATTGEEALDIEVLARMAEITGGGAYQALDRAQLAAAQRTIGQLEPEAYETLSDRPRTSLHHLPLLLVVSGYTVFFTLMMGVALQRDKGERHV